MNLELISALPQTQKHTTPILFVHGMWHAAWCWQEYFMPYFADQGYDVHALSLRGHGASESAKRFWRTSLNDYVSDLSQVIGKMEQKPILVGHSMGGLVVQKYIEKNEVPAAILLASIPPGGVLAATLRTFLKHPWIMLKINLTFSLYHLVSTPELSREAFFSPEMPEESVNKYFNLLQDEAYRAYVDAMGLNLSHPKPQRFPMLVLGAVNDKLIIPKEVEATAKAYGTRAEIFPDMAHDMMVEPCWKNVAERMLTWLNENRL